MEQTVQEKVTTLESQIGGLRQKQAALREKRAEAISQAELLQVEAGGMVLSGQSPERIMARLDGFNKQAGMFDAGIEAAFAQLIPLEAQLLEVKRGLAAEQVASMLAEAGPTFANCKQMAHLLAGELERAQGLYQQIYPKAEVAGMSPEFWSSRDEFAGMLDPALPTLLAKIGTGKYFHSW